VLAAWAGFLTNLHMWVSVIILGMVPGGGGVGIPPEILTVGFWSRELPLMKSSQLCLNHVVLHIIQTSD